MSWYQAKLLRLTKKQIKNKFASQNPHITVNNISPKTPRPITHLKFIVTFSRASQYFTLNKFIFSLACINYAIEHSANISKLNALSCRHLSFFISFPSPFHTAFVESQHYCLWLSVCWTRSIKCCPWEKRMLMNESDRVAEIFASSLSNSLMCIAFIDILLSDLST